MKGKIVSFSFYDPHNPRRDYTAYIVYVILYKSGGITQFDVDFERQL